MDKKSRLEGELRLTETDRNFLENVALPKHTNSMSIKIDNSKVDNMVKLYKKVDAILIPDNATNGDVIRAIFPQWDLREEIGYEYKLFGETHKFEGLVDEDWWNSQYKKEWNKL